MNPDYEYIPELEGEEMKPLSHETAAADLTLLNRDLHLFYHMTLAALKSAQSICQTRELRNALAHVEVEFERAWGKVEEAKEELEP